HLIEQPLSPEANRELEKNVPLALQRETPPGSFSRSAPGATGIEGTVAVADRIPRHSAVAPLVSIGPGPDPVGVRIAFEILDPKAVAGAVGRPGDRFEFTKGHFGETPLLLDRTVPAEPGERVGPDPLFRELSLDVVFGPCHRSVEERLGPELVEIGEFAPPFPAS